MTYNAYIIEGRGKIGIKTPTPQHYYNLFFLILDNTYACDPRIKRFKDEEKERKLAEKKAKEDAVKTAAEEKMKVKS